MALHWQWDEKCGEITVEQKDETGNWQQFPVSLYTGNAFLIMLYEEEDAKTWQMFGFFADKDHAKNCLGLNKKQDYGVNIYDRDMVRFTKLRINKKKYRYTKDLVSMFVQAFGSIVIEVVSE